MKAKGEKCVCVCYFFFFGGGGGGAILHTSKIRASKEKHTAIKLLGATLAEAFPV